MLKKIPVLLASLSDISIKKYLYHLRSRQVAEHLYYSIDHEEMRKLLKYKEQTGAGQYKKYFNTKYWLHENIRRVMMLGLRRNKALSILDIGAGFGYFAYCARYYDHKVVCMDLADVLFSKANEFLGVDGREYRIEPMTAMPSYGTKFDLVTAFQVCFNRADDGTLWGLREWDFFLEDLFENHMNAGGRLYMELNWQASLQAWLPADVKAMFKSKYNAQFEGGSRVNLYAPKTTI